MSTLTAARPSKTGVGKPTQLAAYSIPGQDRILIGQRVEGVVRITDQPADGAGRRYLVERGLEEDGQAAPRCQAISPGLVAESAAGCGSAPE